MGVEEKERTSVFDDKYHVVTLHGELERTLAEAVSQNIRNMDILGNGEQLRVETLDSVKEPGQTITDVFNHVIKHTTFLLFFRTDDFFNDKLNDFAVSASLGHRIKHHDPQRHCTLIPLDVEKTTTIEEKPCFDQLIGIVVSSDGAFDERNEKQIRKMINKKLFKLNADQVTVNEVKQEGQNRQARDICSLVLSADTSGYRQPTQQLNTSGTSLSSSTLTTDFENNTSGIATAASEGTRDLDHEARHGTDFEMSLPSAAQRTPDSSSFQRSQVSGLNTKSSRIPLGGEYAPATSNSLTATAMHRNRDSFRSASINQPSILNPSNMGEHSTTDTFQRQTLSSLPYSVDIDYQGYVQFCVPKLIRPSCAHGNPFGYQVEARTGQQGRTYEQGPQQQHLTHFPNPYGQHPQPYPQVHPQLQWPHPPGIPQEYWNNMGARPKTPITTAQLPPKARTKRCESALFEGGRQVDSKFFSGIGNEHARACHVSLQRDRGRNKRRNWKEKEGKGGKKGAVRAHCQTSTDSYSNPPNTQIPLSGGSKNRAPTPSSHYLPSSVGKGMDSEIDSNVPSNPGKTLREGRQATTSGSQSASDDKMGDLEEGSIRGQEQPTGFAKCHSTGGEQEMRRDNGNIETKDKGNDASPESNKKTSEEAQTVLSRESSHFPQEYPPSSRAILSPENSPLLEGREEDCTNSPACKEAERTIPTQAPLKGTSETSRKEPPDSQRKQEQHCGCLTEDTPKGILTHPSGRINCRRPGSSENDMDIFGSFPELDDAMSELSKCSLTPPSSRKFGNDRSNQSSLQYDCAPSYRSDQEENNGPAAASRRQQNQGPGDESPQKQFHQPLHQQQWQQNHMLHPQQQAWEQQPQPQHHYQQPHQQQEGEGFVELNGRPDLAADRGLNRSRSSSGDTDSGRGTI